MQELCGVCSNSVAAIWRAARTGGALISSASLSVCLPSKELLVGCCLVVVLNSNTLCVEIKAVNREPVPSHFKGNAFDLPASFFFAPLSALFAFSFNHRQQLST